MNGKNIKRRLRRQVKMKGIVDQLIQRKYETKTIPVVHKTGGLLSNFPSLGFGGNNIKRSTVYVNRETGITASQEEVSKLMTILAKIAEAKSRGELAVYLVDPDSLIREFAQEMFATLKEETAVAQ